MAWRDVVREAGQRARVESAQRTSHVVTPLASVHQPLRPLDEAQPRAAERVAEGAREDRARGRADVLAPRVRLAPRHEQMSDEY